MKPARILHKRVLVGLFGALGSCAPPYFHPPGSLADSWLAEANARAAGDSSCALVLANARTVTDSLFVYLSPVTTTADAATRLFQEAVAGKLASFLAFPDTVISDLAQGPDTTVQRPAYLRAVTQRSFAIRDSAYGRTYDATWSFSVTSQGLADSISLDVPAELSPLDDALLEALRRANAEAAFPLVDKAATAQRVAMRLAARSLPDQTLHPVAVIRARFLVFTHEPRAVPNTNPPTYPRAQRNLGRNGSVLTSFVIDSDGRVRQGSVRVAKASHPDFVPAVTSWLPSVVFYPAEFRGCPIATHVQQPFEFAIGR